MIENRMNVYERTVGIGIVVVDQDLGSGVVDVCLPTLVSML